MHLFTGNGQRWTWNILSPWQKLGICSIILFTYNLQGSATRGRSLEYITTAYFRNLTRLIWITMELYFDRANLPQDPTRNEVGHTVTICSYVPGTEFSTGTVDQVSICHHVHLTTDSTMHPPGNRTLDDQQHFAESLWKLCHMFQYAWRTAVMEHRPWLYTAHLLLNITDYNTIMQKWFQWCCRWSWICRCFRSTEKIILEQLGMPKCVWGALWTTQMCNFVCFRAFNFTFKEY